MRNTDYFKGKKITVVGLARSGLGCANLLAGLGAQVGITDINDNESLRLNARQLKIPDTQIELGRHTPGFIKDRDLIVVSPGVPSCALPLVWAKEYNIPAVSEIEVASILCPATIIAVTGSNGKTTVTTLLGRMLKEAGKNVFILGNIGTPFSGEVRMMKEDDFVSLEVSSFQLERIQKFKPKIALILNFNRNHLDRHRDMQEYLQAKKRIFMNQDKEDYLVLNYDDLLLRQVSREAKSKVVYFSGTDILNPNQAAVLSVGSILNIDRALILKVLRDFKGIEHRLEFVTEINRIKFVNDSKSTTVNSTIWALRNNPGQVILICGGRDKGNDYSLISDLIKAKVKTIVAIGESKEKIRKALNASVMVEEVVSLEDAVNLAFGRAQAQDTVLFSPMCASFDMFANYEERGRLFKESVYRLAQNLGNEVVVGDV